MMRQSDNWSGNLQQLFSPQLREELRRHHIVTDTDRLDILQQSSNNHPCKLTRKKALLSMAVSNKTKLLGVASTIDAAFNLEISAALNRFIPVTMRGIDNQGASVHILNLAEPMLIFALKMREYQEAEGAQRTRSGGNTNPMFIPLQVADEFVSTMKEIDKRAVEANASAMCSLLSTSRLSDTQKACTFSKELHDKLDPEHRQCPFCGHFSTIWLPENDTVVSDNTCSKLHYMN